MSWCPALKRCLSAKEATGGRFMMRSNGLAAMPADERQKILAMR
jgi:hypothetical protein